MPNKTHFEKEWRNKTYWLDVWSVIELPSSPKPIDSMISISPFSGQCAGSVVHNAGLGEQSVSCIRKGHPMCWPTIFHNRMGHV